VPVRIAGRAALPVTGPPASVTQTKLPAARPMVWVPLLKATLPNGLRWARSNSAPEAAMTSAATPGPAARARAKAKGVSTWMLGPRSLRLSGIDRNGATMSTRASMAPPGRLSRTRTRSMFAASSQSSTKPIPATTAMYARSLPTIAQVSPAVRFRGKQPIRS
jgi:hypothetical protein